ncbi:UDP-4-amino-4,6-dideoxy-N-acetyl-beta-L-altrosamine transaminase [Paenibacillus sp. PAMC21692]|uniref:UDP-4-amino-4, 6-dideoxy-N-acetyl-beta-L-altrosamine transaminase n=1 Tax=Paenibacillus sp. PAMC21692 TaxID=2762320 RepID=UPI00164DFDE7|nr:UDP-4-amino-4,6-dideoxy-N-acetyl-beta-L-altrosamine transaminase [Paenibacillus sp. PAMC21692]QNK58382.1 UDP-4-amino-4,6-dideoxy-N-acetyl-beta-L-altrosamine transaminase [Paenibacillus sp. PAMC21692]
MDSKPVRNTMLPYGRQWVDDDDIEAVVRVLKSDFLTQGPAIERFERKVARYVGARYAIAFSNGTMALHGACFSAGISTGDEVITSPITFLASSNCVLYMGGTPVFADIKADTWNLDPLEVKKKITPNTKAIIPVDFTGQPVEMERIMEIAETHDLVVIHDAAHSLGASYGNQKVGILGHMTMFSFHPVKGITSGEGGIIVTDNETYYRKLQLFRNHGLTKNVALMEDNDGPWYYEMHELGYNCRMTDLQAALGDSQMNKLDLFVERRREIANLYTEAFSDMPGLVTPYQADTANSAWHLYVVRWSTESFRVSRKEIFEALRSENIGVHVHYIPVYRQPYYKRLGYSSENCPEAEAYYREAITLPLFPSMTDQDIRNVISAVHKVYYMFVRQLD